MVAQSRSRRTSTRVRISKSGQMTLPTGVRKSLGIDTGDYVDIVEDASGKVHLERANPLTIEELAGRFGPPPDGKTVSEYIEEMDRTPMVRRVYKGKRDYDDLD